MLFYCSNREITKTKAYPAVSMEVSNELHCKEGCYFMGDFAGLQSNNVLLTEIKRVSLKMALVGQGLPCQKNTYQQHHISEDHENILRK